MTVLFVARAFLRKMLAFLFWSVATSSAALQGAEKPAFLAAEQPVKVWTVGLNAVDVECNFARHHYPRTWLGLERDLRAKLEIAAEKPLEVTLISPVVFPEGMDETRRSLGSQRENNAVDPRTERPTKRARLQLGKYAGEEAVVVETQVLAPNLARFSFPQAPKLEVRLFQGTLEEWVDTAGDREKGVDFFLTDWSTEKFFGNPAGKVALFRRIYQDWLRGSGGKMYLRDAVWDDLQRRRELAARAWDHPAELGWIRPEREDMVKVRLRKGEEQGTVGEEPFTLYLPEEMPFQDVVDRLYLGVFSEEVRKRPRAWDFLASEPSVIREFSIFGKRIQNVSVIPENEPRTLGMLYNEHGFGGALTLSLSKWSFWLRLSDLVAIVSPAEGDQALTLSRSQIVPYVANSHPIPNSREDGDTKKCPRGKVGDYVILTKAPEVIDLTI